MNRYYMQPTYIEARLWQHRLDLMQNACIIGLFLGIFVLNAVSKGTAHWLVWFWASGEIILAFCTYLVQRKSDQARQAQQEAHMQRMRKLYDRFEQG